MFKLDGSSHVDNHKVVGACLEGFDSKVEPYVVSMRIDVVLQQ